MEWKSPTLVENNLLRRSLKGMRCELGSKIGIPTGAE